MKQEIMLVRLKVSMKLANRSIASIMMKKKQNTRLNTIDIMKPAVVDYREKEFDCLFFFFPLLTFYSLSLSSASFRTKALCLENSLSLPLYTYIESFSLSTSKRMIRALEIKLGQFFVTSLF